MGIARDGNMSTQSNQQIRVSNSAIAIAFLNGIALALIILSIALEQSFIQILKNASSVAWGPLTPFLMIWIVLGACTSLGVYVTVQFFRAK